MSQLDLKKYKKRLRYRFNPFSRSIDMVIVDEETRFSLILRDPASGKLYSFRRQYLYDSFQHSFEAARGIGVKQISEKIRGLESQIQFERTLS